MDTPRDMPNALLRHLAQLHVRDLLNRLGIPWNSSVGDGRNG